MNVSFGTLPRAWQSEDGEDGGKERFIFTEYIEQTTHHSNVSPERERKGKAEKKSNREHEKNEKFDGFFIEMRVTKMMKKVTKDNNDAVKCEINQTVRGIYELEPSSLSGETFFF